MKKQLQLGCVFGAVVMATSALAADLPAKAPIYKVPAAAGFTWQGFYVGVNAGVAASDTKLTAGPNSLIFNSNGENSDISKSGFTGGGQLGYNWQPAANWVLGVEGDIGALSTSRSMCNIRSCAGNLFIVSSEPNFLATARGRFGYAWDRSMFYVTGGAAWVGVKDSWTFFTTGPASERSTTRTGWALGGGIETALAGNWSTKLEYLYVDAGTNRVNYVSGSTAYMDFKHEFNIVRLGLNYKLMP